MTTIDKAALIEHGARAEWEACWPSIPWPDDPDVTAEWRTSTAAALPVIAKALLAPLRELVSDWQANGNSRSLGDPTAAVWQETALQLTLLDAIEAEVQP